MSTFDNPFDSDRGLRPFGSNCGRLVSEAGHEAAAQLQIRASIESEQKRYEGVVASAVMRAMFPQDAARRAFLKSMGAATAVAALSQFFPLKTATEAFAEGGPLEKKDLKVGFIPITCATPIIMAAPMGFYAKNGLNVEVIKTAGWAVIRDKTINKEYDAAHMLSPMPLAITMGAGSNPLPYTMPAVENINGQAITLAVKHKDKRDPKDWEGFKFAVPFDYSMHNYLLRYYLAEHGLDPDVDVQIRAVPPPDLHVDIGVETVLGEIIAQQVIVHGIIEGHGELETLPVLRIALVLVLDRKRDRLAVDVLNRRHGVGQRIGAGAHGDGERHRREHVGGVVFLVDGLVADHRPARGLDDFDVEPVLGVKPHRRRHDDPGRPSDREEADLDVFLLQRAAFGKCFGRGPQREELRQRSDRSRSAHRFQERAARDVARKHRAHHGGGDYALVALLLALEASLDLQSRRRVMLGFADMPAAAATVGAKAAVGIERVVEGGHQLLPFGGVSTPPKSAIAVP